MGNLSGQELVRRFWEGAIRGGYVGHGETYLNEREELWWSKGGDLAGDSPARIRFLLGIIDAAPDGTLEPLPSDWDVRWGGAEDYRIAYFGFGRPRYRDIAMAPGTRWRVDVIDTWNMTIARQPARDFRRMLQGPVARPGIHGHPARAGRGRPDELTHGQVSSRRRRPGRGRCPGR